ncbi:neuronal acetylcholine receptor subunit alpha-2-like isoform X1 [Scylla paramamosain]|uniref:neuronal acetylcholine receptor subunit alpha-2-like isoform X1 n=1 Tax=Scylla paramamosain TaxID=85552 RepID=UPI003083A296
MGGGRAWTVLGLCLVLCYLELAECSVRLKSRWRTEMILKSQLLHEYDHTSLPPPVTYPTVVGIRVMLLQITVDEKQENVLADAWLICEWKDPRLTWDPSKYMNISYVDLPHSAIWKPDISMYNSPESAAFQDLGESLANVSHTGQVHIVAGIKMQYFCVVDLTYWPHDNHNCTLQMGSWRYNKAGIDLELVEDKPRMEALTRLNPDGGNLTRGWWRLVNSSMARYEEHFDCCPDPFVSIRMYLVLTRDAPAFQWTVKMPVVALCILTFIMFLLPPCAGEKLIFGGICLILDVLFIAYSSITVSHAPSHTPLIVELVCQQLLLTVASVVVTAITTRLARDPHATPLSSQVTTCLHLMSVCLCLNNYRSLIVPSPWQSMRNYNASVKTEEVEMGENGRAQLFSNTNNSNASSPQAANHMLSSPSSSSSSYSGLDYLLLAAAIDRLCLVIFVLIFIINMLTYSSVL